MKIPVIVKPRSRTEAVEQTPEGYVVCVKEPAVENRANNAAVRLLAEHFGVAKSYVAVVRGAKSRRKVVEVAFPAGYVRT